MKISYCVLVLAFSGLLLSGCSNRNNDADHARLKNLDSLLTTQPERVLDSLSRMPLTEFSGFNRNYSGLLKTIAQDKAYYNFTTDSSVNDITRYFSGHRQKHPDLYARSLLYQGIVRYRLGVTDSTAYEPIKEAADFLKKKQIDNPLLLFFCHDYLGLIHGNNNNTPLSIQYLKNAIHYAKSYGKEEYLFRAYLETSWAYLQMEEYGVTKQYIDTLMRFQKLSVLQEHDLNHLLAVYYEYSDQPNEALKINKRILKSKESFNDISRMYYRISENFQELNTPDSALYYGELAAKNIKDTTYYLNYLYYNHIGELSAQLKLWQKSSLAYQKAYTLREKATKKELDKHVLELEKKYDKSEAENTALKYKTQSTFISVVAVLLFVVLLTSIFFWMQKRKQIQLEKQLREANFKNIESENLRIKQESELLDEKNRVLEIEKKQAERLLLEKEFVLPFYHQISNRNNELKRLLEYLIDNEKDQKMRDKIMTGYQNFTESTDISEDDSVTSKLLTVFTGLTDESFSIMNNSDKLLMVFESIGLQNEQIAVLFNTTPDSIRSRKSKLKKKMLQHNIHYPN